MRPETTFVFVYGTLRKGFGNHSLLRTARFLGPARTRKPYAMYADRVPYVVRGEDVTPITGEVYEVNNRTLRSLDRLEDHPHWYQREPVAVLLEDGSDVIAWMYFFPRPRGVLIPSGDFSDRRQI